MNVDDFLNSELSRRRFLGDSARNAAGMAAGIVGLGQSAFGDASAGERIRVAVIGVRSYGGELAAALARLPDVKIATLCDVDRGVLEAATDRVTEVQGARPAVQPDFRRVLDDPSIQAVVIATPDHWHAAMTVLACQAGKDVYVEAPVSHTIADGAAMVAAARKHKRIVQSGLQQRSGEHFRTAVELVKNGEIGNVRLAKAWVVHRRKPISFKTDGPAPEGVDYDRWLGPAPAREFNPNRFHYNWHWFWDYGSGELGNWGVHLLDVARWGLGAGLPLRISATGGKLYFHDDQQTPDTLSVQFSYPKASLVWEHRTWSNHGVEGRSAAVAFYGDNGTLIVDRGGWKVYGRRDTLTADASELLTAHLRNFIDCVKSRKTPAADIEVGHLSSTLCHLGNIAWRLGREVQFDPAGMNFGWDGEANRLLSSEAREPWALPTA